MNPVDALAQALSLDREAAKPLVMGLGMVAAAAIAATFNVDLYSALVFGLLIVAAGAVLYIVGAVIGDPLLKKVLSWFLVLFLMLMMVMTFIVAVFRPAGWPPAYCIIQFFRNAKQWRRV